MWEYTLRMRPKLYTFPISHFSEKARWALDLSGIDYELCPLKPGFHIEIIKAIAPETTVPVLELKPGQAIQGSSKIIDHVEERAFGKKSTDTEKRKEEDLDEKIGKPFQTIIYSFILTNPQILGKLLSITPPEKDAMVENPETFESIAVLLKRRYKITEKKVEESFRIFQEAVEDLIAIYSNNNYFFENRFGRVDLTVASLLSVLSTPVEHPAKSWFDSVTMPDSFNSWKNKEIYQKISSKILEMYKLHRYLKPIP